MTAQGGVRGQGADARCVDFLRWALPRMGLRWRGYRRVRGQVRKRLARRLAALGLGDLDAYRERLEADASEWAVLDALCRIPISRFWRHAGLWRGLADALPALARPARCWSAGCASGEEPYSLAILAASLDLPVEILATDADEGMLARAPAAAYPPSSLKELPADLRARAFARDGDAWVLRPEFRGAVRFERGDVREAMPPGPFHLVLHRYVAFTYFEEAGQRAVLEGIAARVPPGGLLAIGAHERPPSGAAGWRPRTPSLLVRTGT